MEDQNVNLEETVTQEQGSSPEIQRPRKIPSFNPHFDEEVEAYRLFMLSVQDDE